MNDLLQQKLKTDQNYKFWLKKGASLVPLKTANKNFITNKKKRLRKEGFYTFDTETKDGLKGTKLFCWGLAYRERTQEIKVLQGYDDLTPLFDKLREWKDKSHYRIIYVHNLGFDARFLADYCARHNIKYKPLISGSKMLVFTIDELKIKFIDSYQFLLETQEKAELTWNVPEELRKIDCKEIFEKDYKEWSNQEKQRVFEHNANDIKALHIIMQNYRKTMFEISGVDCLSVVSLASLSLKAFRKTMDRDIENPFIYTLKNKENKITYKIDHARESFVRASYYGGRNEVFNTNVLKNGLYIDRVSMYPSEMYFNEYPIGYPIWFGNPTFCSNDYDIADERIFLEDIIDGVYDYLGFIEATISYTSEVKTIYPIIPTRMNDRVLFTNTTFTGVYTTAELKYAKKIGYNVVPIKGLIYPEKRKIFNGFIDEFYPIKQHSTGGKKKGAKIILNSCYGKFGQKMVAQSPIFHYFSEESKLNEYMDNTTNKVHVRYNEEMKLWITVELQKTEIRRTFMNVGIASFVTAYARLSLTKFMHEMEQNGVEIYYCDTDSITIARFGKNGKDYKSIYTSEKHELGDWDIEQEFDYVKFLAPKAYISIQNGKPKLKLKGVERRKIKEIVKKCRTISEIEEMIREPIEMAEKYMTFTQSHRYGTILATKKLIKHYSFENRKRNFSNDGTSIAWENNTVPNWKNKKSEYNNSSLIADL
ncbi:MAG: DNA polymerase [Promethearchaeia archaeon]